MRHALNFVNLYYSVLIERIFVYLSNRSALRMKGFKQNKAALNKELDKFINTLNELLPRYSALLNQDNISKEELEELGEIEHFLIEVNNKISEIKSKLEQDLFGHTLDIYFKLKERSANGDLVAKAKLERLRSNFEEDLQKGGIVNWN